MTTIEAMLYPAYSLCPKCNVNHLYVAFSPSQIALLKKLVGLHKQDKMARKTLKCIEESLEGDNKYNYHGRFRCAHCHNEYIAVQMSGIEHRYLQQILDHIWCSCIGVPRPNHNHGDIIVIGTDDSEKHGLADVLWTDPIPDVEHMLECHSGEALFKDLDRCQDVHIREFPTRSRGGAMQERRY